MNLRNPTKITLPVALAIGLCAGALTVGAQSYSNAVMALNPVLYYPLNDTTPNPNDGFTNAGTAGSLGYMFDEWSDTYAPTHQAGAGPIVAETNQAPHYDGTSGTPSPPIA